MVRSRTPTCPKANRRGRKIEKGKLAIEESESGVKSPIRRFNQPRSWVPYNWVSFSLKTIAGWLSGVIKAKKDSTERSIVFPID